MRISVAGFTVRAVAIVAGCAVLGFGGVLDPVHATLLGCVLFAGLLVHARASEPEWAPWPSHPSPTRDGGRGGVSLLAWQVVGPDGRVNPRVLERTRRLAAARLALAGIDLADPAQRADVERLLGVGVSAALLAGEAPTPRVLQTWLDAIDHLDHERTTL